MTAALRHTADLLHGLGGPQEDGEVVVDGVVHVRQTAVGQQAGLGEQTAHVGAQTPATRLESVGHQDSAQTAQQLLIGIDLRRLSAACHRL